MLAKNYLLDILHGVLEDNYPITNLLDIETHLVVGVHLKGGLYFMIRHDYYKFPLD